MQNTKPQAALITGGAGFIGSHLAEALLKLGYEVAIIDDLSTGRFENIAHLTDHPRFNFAIDSVNNEVVMEHLVSECDVVFHLAAAVGVKLIARDPARVIETNVLGAHAVLKVANRYRRKVLLASTSEIYGKNDNMPLREDDDRLLGPTTERRWSYSTSKAAGETLGLAYYQQMGLPVTIFRLFNTVGPRQTGQYGMVIPRLTQQALQGKPLTVYGDGQQTRCFCHVSDAVGAIVGLAECAAAAGQVFNIGSTEEISILDLARKIIRLADELNLGPVDFEYESERIKLVPYERAYETTLEDMRRRVPDISKIRRFTGWEPERSLDETLKDIITSYAGKEIDQTA